MFLHTQEVRGSSPCAPTLLFKGLQCLRLPYESTFGYKTSCFFPSFERCSRSHKRVFRVHQAAGLCVKGRQHKRLVRIRQQEITTSAPNQQWAIDFVHDHLASSCRADSPRQFGATERTWVESNKPYAGVEERGFAIRWKFVSFCRRGSGRRGGFNVPRGSAARSRRTAPYP